MEIKGIFDRYKVNSNTKQMTANQVQKPSTVPTEKKEGLTADTISVSSNASVQTTYAKEVKMHATAAKNNIDISSERLNALKLAYKGDECPVSSEDIASSIIYRNLMI